MDNRPIGIFDSGVGGLSAVRKLVQDAPEESFVYFGDTARVPYGDRTPEDIRRLSLQDARFLRTNGIKALVIACNTITANALSELTGSNPDIPVIGVIEPAAAQAAMATRTGRIGVIATNATVNSGVYTRAIGARLPGAKVTEKGCPGLVPLIESGHTETGDGLLMPVLREYLAPLQAAGADTVVLGCTHYPLIADAVRSVMGGDVRLVDSGAACIETVLAELAARDALADPGQKGGTAYYCSAREDDFVSVAERFMGFSIADMTREIDIGAY